MKRKKLRFGKGFRVVFGNRGAQAAEMVIEPGDGEGGPDNKHQGADQWLFVVEGEGTAIINEKKYRLSAGTLLLIEAGDLHEIKNSGSGLLKTLNFYDPPAYDAKGNRLPAGKKRKSSPRT